MKPEAFACLSALLKKRSGLILTEDKGYLVESRLNPVAQKHGLPNLDALFVALQRGNEALAAAVTEAMTTNETSFFRDTKPFDMFRKEVLPEILERKAATRSLRIWSAAASTGQESYSLAMLLREEAAKLAGWRIEIVGTDISEAALKQARAGIFSHFEVQRGLPAAMLVKYFEKVDGSWQINSLIRSMVQFRSFNLLDNLSPLGSFDVIFCRNVLIYFDVETKGQVLAAMSKRMNDKAVLFLGGAETVLGVSEQFEPVPGSRGLYRVAGGASKPALKPVPTGFASAVA
ncbi:MAG TPA: protein-glutamate O-methyltransferase CheR [Magnetospirillaceae bacterium]|jgi:chemotaxis protein methyltransferase CheR